VCGLHGSITTTPLCGYHVLDASSGVEALRLTDGYKAVIHLLFTDVIMPQMGGRELARRLEISRPGLRVIYTSGYDEGAVVPGEGPSPEAMFLQKPITLDLVLRTVRGALDTPRRDGE
jgi:DNA-binding NtrC family response regulator